MSARRRRWLIRGAIAAAVAGAAVATGGLTFLFRSIDNRITAEKKVCVNALAKIRRRKEAREAKSASQPAR